MSNFPNQVATAPSDHELKARHRALWASGDYDRLAHDLIWALGPRVVDAAGIRPTERVLDVAAGSGNVAIPAALRGARVVATDLTPELLERGRARAAAAGAELEWRVADAEHLPFADDSFDVAVSCVGIMFAPHHEQAAEELLRVVRPGGRLTVLNWTPGGFIGQLFRTMKPFAAPLPDGASPAPLWGDETHVRELFGAAVTDLTFRTGEVVVERFEAGRAFREYFASHYGPTIATYARHSGDIARVAELDAALDALGDAQLTHGRMSWEYLIATATVSER